MKEKRVRQKEDRSRIRAILQSMDIDMEERFQWGWETSVQDFEYDWKLIKNDVSFNLKDDLTYLHRIRQNYNTTIPDTEDQKILEAELTRIKRMYTYKINYLTIMSHFQNVEKQQKIELAQLEKVYLNKITLLKLEPTKPIYFKKKTHSGYIKKMTSKINQLRDQKRKEVLAKEKEEAITIIKQDEKNLIEEVTQFLKIDDRYIPLIKAGVMLLPSGSRLAAIFPKSQWLTFGRSNKKDRHEAMHQHARQLLMEHSLFIKPGILPKSRKGCICIMYIKEGHMKDNLGATFRPVFGASGITPYGENHNLKPQQIESNSYTSMGVPDPSDIADISYKKTAERLLKHVDIMQRLGIKPPSMQSSLYFLQTPEYRDNKNKQNSITMLESWKPSNCAEPAIMTAIYQMYSRPADIYLSVPFEGYLSEGKLLLKYTCARCALSEPAFMSPVDTSTGHRLTDMRLQSNKSFLISDRILSAGLMYNHVKKKNNEEDKAHPYSKKDFAIERTALLNQTYGFEHVKRGHEQVAMDTTMILVTSQKFVDNEHIML